MNRNCLTAVLSLLLLALCGQQPLFADDISRKLPADFQRVRTFQDLDEACLFVVGALNKEGRMYMLTAETAGTNGKKMKGLPLSKDWEEESVYINNAATVWRIRHTEGTCIRLVAAQSGFTLTRLISNALGLALTKETSALSDWQVEESDGETFVLADPTSTNRKLSLSEYFKGAPYFDNFSSSDSWNLYLFKLPPSFSDFSGDAQMPADGGRVALAYHEVIRSVTGNPLPTADLALCNGTFAPTDELESWTCQTEGASAFSLHNGQGYLDFNLQASAQKYVWQIQNGHIATGEDIPRFLCYDTDGEKWIVADEKTARTGATFATIANDPEKSLSDQGVLTLTGGWTASSLADLPLDGVANLDLTHLALPLAASDFFHKDTNRNVPIYIKGSMADYVPQTWKWVISCDTTNNLLRPTELTDRAAFSTSKGFYVKEGQLTYQRHFAEGGTWQTLMLPFTASYHTGQAYRVRGVNGNGLVLDKSSIVQAGLPYLFRASEAGDVTFTSNVGSILPNLVPYPPLTGVYEPLTVSSEAEGIYLLSPSANAFVHAAATSRLAPFRCYLTLTDGSKAMLKIK